MPTVKLRDAAIASIDAYNRHETLHYCYFMLNNKTYYIKKDGWYKDAGVKFDIFNAKWGTNTYPTASVVLHDHEIDAETLVIKVTNTLNKLKESHTPMKKYVPLFEEYVSQLNEANEEIKAQGICKNAAFIVQKDLEATLKLAEKYKMIDSFKTKVEPWNRGYMLKYELKVNKDFIIAQYKKYDSASDYSIITKFLGTTSSSIFVQPATFFQSNFEEGRNAFIEYSTFGYLASLLGGKDYSGSIEIHDKNEISKAVDVFIKQAKLQLDGLTASIEEEKETITA